MNERLTIQDLTDLLITKHSMTKKDAEAFVKEFFLLIEQSLQHENFVKVKGLGTFKLIGVDSRESVNVNTGERFQIKGHTKVSFTPDSSLRDTINKPFAHFETVVLNENTILEDTLLEDEEEEIGENFLTQTASESKNNTVQEEENITEKNLAPEATEISVIEEIIIEDSAVELESIPMIQENVVQQQHTTPEPTQETEDFIAENNINKELIKVSLKSEESIAKVESAQSTLISISPPQKVHKKEKSLIPYLIAIIVIVLLSCGGVILFSYYPDVFSSSTSKNIIDVPIVTQPDQPEKQFIADTITKKDSVKKAISEKPKEEADRTQTIVEKNEAVVTPVKAKIPIIQKQSASVYTDSATYKITGTKTSHTIKEGETLTKVSLRFYGTKAMWPYIVKHNTDVIKNPDNVPYGTTIKIPELTKN